MKDFYRKAPIFSLCGLNCGLCVMYLGRHCPGCGGGKGNQSCAIARCSLQHGNVPFCWECPEYPCPHYDGFDAYDSFVPRRNRKKDIAKAKAIGLEAYLNQLRERMAILDELLAHYNDGRRKTFFDTAVYLLELEDLRSAIAQLRSQPELMEKAVKERALAAAALLQSAADRQGICLRLVKKPKKK